MRAAALVAVGWLLLTLQTSALWILPGVPDFVVPIAFYLGYTRSALRGALLAGALGYLADLLGGGPRGLQILLAMLVSFLGSGASTRFVVRAPLVVSVVTLLASLISQLVALGLLAAFYRDFRHSELLVGTLLPVSIATGVVAAPVHWLCAWIDRIGKKELREGLIP